MTRWTTQTLADYLNRTENTTLSHNDIAGVLGEAGVRLPTRATQHGRRARRREPLDVRVEFVVVNEPYARALRERQTEAIAAILRWVREHPE